MASDATGTVAIDAKWAVLCRLGGAAALLAGLLLRRNLAVEVSLVAARKAPDTAAGWLTLLQSDRLLALTYLHLFDVANYVLLAVMFCALAVVLPRTSRSWAGIATGSALVGTTAYLATNPAISMLGLSGRYGAAATGAQRLAVAASADALLASGRFTAPGAHPGSAGYASLLLLAIATLIASALMISDSRFGRPTAIVGMLAAVLDLGYCAAYLVVPSGNAAGLALTFIPAAGLFLMVWHVLVGWRLWRIGRSAAAAEGRARA